MMDMPPLPEPAGFSAGDHDCALFTKRRGTGENFAKGSGTKLMEWYTADQLHARDAQWRAIVAAEVLRERERWSAGAKISIPTDVMEQEIAVHVRRAVARERERCAKVCDGLYVVTDTTERLGTSAECAAAIRKGDKP